MVLLRFYEFIISVLIILLSGQFFLPSKIGNLSKKLIIGFISAFGLVLLLLHVLLEGIRWQMVLIYILSLIFFGWGIYQLIKEYYKPPSDSTIQEQIKKVMGIKSQKF